MTLEVAVNEVVAETKSLVSTVAGKVGEIDSKVSEAEHKIDNFIASANELYKSHSSTKFKVDGEWGKFYPVRINLRGGPTNSINLYRYDIHANRGSVTGLSEASSPGTFSASITAVSDSWEHRIPFYFFDSYAHKTSRFIGKVVNHSRVSSLFVWLRGGGVDYFLNHDGYTINDDDINVRDEEYDISSAVIEVFNAGCVSENYGINYQPIEESEIDAGLPSSGYIRGIS